MVYNFALIGAAGYIAPRHLRAIKENGQNLVSVLDKNDSVGILDSYFPDASFFTEFERFDRYTEMLRRAGEANRIHYVSICSPNYLHDSHIRFALREDAHAVCEKPVVLNPWNAEALRVLSQDTGRQVNVILQLRLHPAIVELKKKVEQALSPQKYDIVLTYITPRGSWYHFSWKGDVVKSGGVATNIGIHFFDMLIWIFGKVQKNTLHLSQSDKAAGVLELEKANVKWFLSIDGNDLQQRSGSRILKPFRSIKIDDQELDFSEGFTDLHTASYREILKGNGFSIDDAYSSIEVAYTIRNAAPVAIQGEYHPFLRK